LDENPDKNNRPKELTLAEKIYKENKVYPCIIKPFKTFEFMNLKY
jgi:hypothetical protein